MLNSDCYGLNEPSPRSYQILLSLQVAEVLVWNLIESRSGASPIDALWDQETRRYALVVPSPNDHTAAVRIWYPGHVHHESSRLNLFVHESRVDFISKECTM